MCKHPNGAGMGFFGNPAIWCSDCGAIGSMVLGKKVWKLPKAPVEPTILHRNRPDLAPDAVEIAIFGIESRVFTLILSGSQKMAWIEIVSDSVPIQIAFPIDKVAHLILNYVESERQRQRISDIVAAGGKELS